MAFLKEKINAFVTPPLERKRSDHRLKSADSCEDARAWVLDKDLNRQQFLNVVNGTGSRSGGPGGESSESEPSTPYSRGLLEQKAKDLEEERDLLKNIVADKENEIERLLFRIESMVGEDGEQPGWQKQYYDLMKQYDEKSKELESTKDKLDKAEQMANKLYEIMESADDDPSKPNVEMAKAIKSMSPGRQDELEDRLQIAEDKLKNAYNEIDSLKQDLEFANAQVDALASGDSGELNKMISDLRNELSSTKAMKDAENKALKDSIQGKDDEIKQLKDLLNKLEQEKGYLPVSQGISGKTDDFGKPSPLKEDNLADLKNKIADLEMMLNSEKDANKELKDDMNKEREKFNKLASADDNGLKKMLADAEEDNRQLKMQLDQLAQMNKTKGPSSMAMELSPHDLNKIKELTEENEKILQENKDLKDALNNKSKTESKDEVEGSGPIKEIPTKKGQDQEDVKVKGLLDQISQLMEENEALKSDNDALKTAMNEIEKEFNKIKKDTPGTDKLNDSSTFPSTTNLEKENEHLDKILKDQQDKIKALEEELKGMKEEKDEYNERLAKKDKTIQELESNREQKPSPMSGTATDQQHNAEQCDEEKAKLKGDIKELNDKIRALQNVENADVGTNETPNLLEEIEKLKKEKNQLQEENKRHLKEKDAVTSAKPENIIKDTTDVEAQNKELNEQLKELQKELETLKKENNQLKENNRELTKRQESLPLAPSESVKDSSDLEAQNNKLKLENQKILNELDKLKEENNNFKIYNEKLLKEQKATPLTQTVKDSKGPSDIEEQNKKLQQKLKLLEDQLQELKDEAGQAGKPKKGDEKLNEENKRLLKENELLKLKIEESSNLPDVTLKDDQILRDKLNSLETLNKKLEGQLHDAKYAQLECEKENVKLSELLKQAADGGLDENEVLKMHKDKNDNLKLENEALKKTISELQSEADRLRNASQKGESVIGGKKPIKVEQEKPQDKKPTKVEQEKPQTMQPKKPQAEQVEETQGIAKKTTTDKPETMQTKKPQAKQDEEMTGMAQISTSEKPLIKETKTPQVEQVGIQRIAEKGTSDKPQTMQTKKPQEGKDEETQGNAKKPTSDKPQIMQTKKPQAKQDEEMKIIAQKSTSEKPLIKETKTPQKEQVGETKGIAEKATYDKPQSMQMKKPQEGKDEETQDNAKKPTSDEPQTMQTKKPQAKQDGEMKIIAQKSTSEKPLIKETKTPQKEQVGETKGIAEKAAYDKPQSMQMKKPQEGKGEEKKGIAKTTTSDKPLPKQTKTPQEDGKGTQSIAQEATTGKIQPKQIKKTQAEQDEEKRGIAKKATSEKPQTKQAEKHQEEQEEKLGTAKKPTSEEPKTQTQGKKLESRTVPTSRPQTSKGYPEEKLKKSSQEEGRSVSLTNIPKGPVTKRDEKEIPPELSQKAKSGKESIKREKLIPDKKKQHKEDDAPKELSARKEAISLRSAAHTTEKANIERKSAPTKQEKIHEDTRMGRERKRSKPSKLAENDAVKEIKAPKEHLTEKQKQFIKESEMDRFEQDTDLDQKDTKGRAIKTISKKIRSHSLDSYLKPDHKKSTLIPQKDADYTKKGKREKIEDISPKLKSLLADEMERNVDLDRKSKGHGDKDYDNEINRLKKLLNDAEKQIELLKEENYKLKLANEDLKKSQTSKDGGKSPFDDSKRYLDEATSKLNRILQKAIRNGLKSLYLEELEYVHDALNDNMADRQGRPPTPRLKTADDFRVTIAKMEQRMASLMRRLESFRKLSFDQTNKITEYSEKTQSLNTVVGMLKMQIDSQQREINQLRDIVHYEQEKSKGLENMLKSILENCKCTKKWTLQQNYPGLQNSHKVQ